MPIKFVCRAALCALLLSLIFAAAGCSKDKGETAASASNPPSTAAATMDKIPPRASGDLAKPFYPPDARSRGEQGVVQLNLHVLSDGRVDDANVLKSSGYPQLDEYAVRGARRWRMTPGTVGGKPTTMWHSFRVTYKLD